MITIRNLWKRFGQQQVLAGINLDIRAGETLAIVGPSGTGKTVLLKILSGLLEADGGDVMIGGESMTGARRMEEKRRIREKLGVLFQAAALFDSLTLFDNVAFPLRERRRLAEREIRERALQHLEEVGLRGYERAYPGEVSIGMRKRVGIARALVTQPEVILFDEPNTGLDPLTGQEIYDLIRETQQHFGFTGVVISHEIPEVFQICSRVAMLYQGQLQTVGTVQEFLASENPAVRQFIAGSTDGPIAMS